VKQVKNNIEKILAIFLFGMATGMFIGFYAGVYNVITQIETECKRFDSFYVGGRKYDGCESTGIGEE